MTIALTGRKDSRCKCTMFYSSFSAQNCDSDVYSDVVQKALLPQVGASTPASEHR
eukprot:COSAG02_NODE_3834_length_6173_cov_6.023708_3_plen_55_part_00